MPNFLIFSLFFIHLQFSVEFIFFVSFQFTSSSSGKPTPYKSLDEQSSFPSSIFPHIWIKIKIGLYNFISSGVNEDALFFHLSSYFPFNFGWFADPFIGLSLSSVTEFVLSFLLIGLSKSIPILDFRINMSVASNEWFFVVDSDDFDDLSPLFGNITFLISFNDCGFNMIIVVIPLIVGCVHFYIIRLIELVILRH